jgi:hypothetical protein
MNDIHSVDYIPTLSYQNAIPSRVARLPSMGSSDGGTLVAFEEGNHASTSRTSSGHSPRVERRGTF